MAIFAGLFILPTTPVLLAVSLVGWGIGNKVEVRA